MSDAATAIRWIRERSFRPRSSCSTWYHHVEALRRAIGDERPARLETALMVAAPGGDQGLCELLAG